MTELNKNGVIGLLHLHKGIRPSHMAPFPFQKCMCFEEYVFCTTKKDSYIDTENDDKEYMLLLLYKNSVLFYLWLQGCWEEVWGRRWRGSNGIKRKLLKRLNMCVVLFWGYSLIIIKCDSRKFFLKIEKWLTTSIKDKKVTYSKLSFKLWIVR